MGGLGTSLQDAQEHLYGKGLNCARLDNHWGLHHAR